MKKTIKGLKLFMFALISIGFLTVTNTALASFVVGETYTISIEAVQSNGSVTSNSAGTSLAISTLAVADANGKLTFTLGSIPSSSSYNWLVVTIKDSNGTTIRRSIVPAPAAGSTLNLGVSPLTNKQTDAFLTVFSNAGTDDPILAFFGFILVRSANVTATEIITMADICQKGIYGSDGTGNTNGFLKKLIDEGATATQLANLRSNLVANLAEFASLYKDAVDNYFTSGTTAELAKRGEAAAKLFEYLVAATSDAGIREETLLLAFNAMGAIVLPAMDAAITSGTLSAAIEKGLEASIGRGLQKLRADNFLKKYRNALTTLNATDEEISTYTTAVNTLTAALKAQFEEFEKNCMKDDEDVAIADMEAKNNEMQQGMNNAFNQFMTDCQASDAQILALRQALATAFSIAAGDMDTVLPTERFQYYTGDATQSSSKVNWPIMMVVATRWMANIVIANGGLTYTRDDTTPSSNMWWLGYCQTNTHWNQSDCSEWVVARRNYADMYQANMTSWAILEMLREDIQILQFKRWDAFSNEVASATDEAAQMEAMEAAEKAFYDKLFDTSSSTSLVNLLDGTLDGTTTIPAATKKALITVFLDPDF